LGIGVDLRLGAAEHGRDKAFDRAAEFSLRDGTPVYVIQ
jgi:hypothetical protein